MTVAFHVQVFPHRFANSKKVDDYLPIPPRFLPGGVEICYQRNATVIRQAHDLRGVPYSMQPSEMLDKRVKFPSRGGVAGAA